MLMSILAFFFSFQLILTFFQAGWVGFRGDWKAVVGILFEFLSPPLASFLLCVPSTPVPHQPPGISLPGSKAVRLKPEIMTFHCHTGEMNETTKYHPINNGLFTAGEEVSSARFLDPKLILEVPSTWKELGQMLPIPRIFEHFQEILFVTYKL